MSDLPRDPEARKRVRRDPKWRKIAGDAARRQLETAAADKGELEDKLVEAATTMQPERMGLPLTFLDQAGGQEMAGGHLIQQATAGDIENYTAAPGRTCGTCRYFNLKGGQAAMVKQRFAERLVLEQEWALKHLGAPLDHAGVCDQSGGEMVTMTISKADDCAGYRPKGRLFR